MKEESPKYSQISKLGPMLKIEGGLIFKYPFQSRALKGYDSENAIRDSEPFLNSILSESLNWFENFPDCCDSHKEVARLGNFDKTKFEFIPSQILNNVKYFAHSLEVFIGEEEGMKEIKDYLDYLNESFGSPSIGGGLFEGFVKLFIERGTLNNKEFTDDQRLELLAHLEPTTPPFDSNESDLDSLYTAFQKWLDSMPNVGEFKKLKENFKGKIVVDVFFKEFRFNKYLRCHYVRPRSRSELLKLLEKMTIDILRISKAEITKENYDKDKMIHAAEEKLRIQQHKLLECDIPDLEISYLDMVEKWLSMIVDFYQVISQAIIESNSKKSSIDISGVLSKLESLQVDINSFCNSIKISTWIKSYLSDKSFEELGDVLDKVNQEEGRVILDSVIDKLKIIGLKDVKLEDLEKKVNDSEIAFKHKLKLSIPLFLFTKYEGEIELSDKQKLPRNLKELKDLLFG
jgi:hypothetical protein